MEGSSNEYGVELNLSNDTAVTNTSIEFYTDVVLGKWSTLTLFFTFVCMCVCHTF